MPSPILVKTDSFALEVWLALHSDRLIPFWSNKCACVRMWVRAKERYRGERREKEAGGRIDQRLLKSCSGFSWSEVCACRRASPVQPPFKKSYFLRGREGDRKETFFIFEREKDLHNTSEVDKSARLDSFCVLSCVFLLWCLNETGRQRHGRAAECRFCSVLGGRSVSVTE